MHRIQRVPPTEKRRRVHTSTIAVALMDEQDRQIALQNCDLSKRWHSGTGAGGQHRNKTQNCLELTHLPTGISVSANGRSRKENERQALHLLEQAVQDHLNTRSQARSAADRREQAGDRSRSGIRIRTWKLQDGKVIDHRSGQTARMKDVERTGVAGLWPD